MVQALGTRLVLVIVTLFTLAACGGSKNTNPTATPVTAQEILQQAADRFDAVNTVHFVLQLNGNIALDSGGTVQLRAAEGDLVRPDSSQAKANVSFGGTNLSVSMISIGNDQYITNFLSGTWEKAPPGLGYNPSILFDKDKGISAILRRVNDAEMAGTDTVDGIKAYHLKGTVDQAAVDPLAPGAFKGNQVNFEIWISTDSKDVLKTVIQSPATGGGNSSTTWTLLTSKQNAPVTIQRPPA